MKAKPQISVELALTSMIIMLLFGFTLGVTLAK